MECNLCQGKLELLADSSGGLLHCSNCHTDQLVSRLVAEQAKKMGLVVVEVSEKRILVGVEVTVKSTISNHPPIAVAEITVVAGKRGECGVVVDQKVFGELRPKVDELLGLLRARPIEGLTVIMRGEYIKPVLV